MQEKILAKLKQQRGQNLQVSDKTLEDMAKTWAQVVKDDEMLNGIDFTEQLSSLQGNIGHIAKQVKEDTLKNYKPEPKPEPTPKPKPGEPKPDDMPEWAKALIESNKQNTELLAKLQGEKITTTRTSQLEAILKDAPKAYKDQALANFNKMSFTDDDDFNSYVETTKTNFEGFQQMAKEQGVTFPTPGANIKKPVDDGLSDTFKKVLEAKEAQEKKD